MAKVIIDKALVAFLKSKGEDVFSSFVDNVVLDGDFTDNERIKSFASAFMWYDSPQGGDFWSDLDDEFFEKMDYMTDIDQFEDYIVNL